MSYLEREHSPLSGPIVPFGALGVSAIMAALLGLVGLLLPTALIESMAFQLYLDTLIASAVPPFGWLAKIGVALALASLGALLGYGLARIFGVRSDGFGFSKILSRLRGVGDQDDDDAPFLRTADRHPDAPARRPFSAATDIPARHTAAGEWSQHWDDLPEDDDDELLLTSNFSDAEPLELGEAHMPAPYVEESFGENDYVAVVPTQVEMPAGVEHEAAAPYIAVPPAPPLDLSIARLDELLARLESGLAGRRTQHSAAVVMAEPIKPEGFNAAVSSAPSHPQETAVANERDLTFPQDPALAAALATLRRMNQHVG